MRDSDPVRISSRLYKRNEGRQCQKQRLHHSLSTTNSNFDQDQVIMKFLTLFLGGLASLAAAQTAVPYTDAKSGITFNYLALSSGYFFGLTLPANGTGNTDFIATIGGKGTGWSGVSLGGGMLNKLLIAAWPNGQSIVSSFRKTA
jgi:hypothetical protein